MNDKDILPWMTAHLPDNPRILELGAHYCEDTEQFISMFTRPVITVFEPDPRNTAVIRGKKLPVTLIEAAVGAVDGTAELYLSGKTNGLTWTHSSSIRRPKLHLQQHPTISFAGTANVTLVKLDTAMGHSREPIDFIWCDVQGNEADVIRGGMETLRRTQYFYTEFDNQEMYEGQENLAVLQSLLNGVFVDIGHYGMNVLFKNILP